MVTEDAAEENGLGLQAVHTLSKAPAAPQSNYSSGLSEEGLQGFMPLCLLSIMVLRDETH